MTKTAGAAPSPSDAPAAEAAGTEGLGEPPPPQHPIKRIIKPRKPIVPATDELPAAKPAATAKPPAAKPVKPAKPASKPGKAWVDPFAQ